MRVRYAPALCMLIGGMMAVPALGKDVMLMNRIGPSRMTLYVANADGSGERRLLPQSEALDYDATFSPDGKWIVFTSERDPEGAGQADIWRVHPDGTGLEQLTSDSSMEDAGSLSPDGKKLVYVSTKGGSRTANIWVMDLVTRQARNLTADGKTDPPLTMRGHFRPAWSPDGKWIAFTSDRGEPWSGAESGAGAGHWHPTSLYVMRADGRDLRRLTSTTPVEAIGSPKWSRDGKRIAVYRLPTKDTFAARMDGFPGAPFATTSQIVEVDVASGGIKAVTDGPGLKTNPQYLPGGNLGYLLKVSSKDAGKGGIAYSNGAKGPQGVVRSPAWAPDGKTVIYYKLGLKNRAQYTQLYSWDAQREYRYTDVFPAVCPANGKLALTDLDFPFGNPTASVSILDPDGSRRQKLFQRPDGASLVPTWSPDCQWIAFGFGVFFGGRGFAPAHLHMVKADGSEQKELLSGPFNVGFPTWSPDGATIVYRTWGDDKGKDSRGLRALKLADRSVTVLTSDWDNFPFYSPSGDRVVFTRRMPDADFEVFTMKADGSDVKRLTQTRGADAHATWSDTGEEIWFESSRTGFKDEAALYDTSPQPYAQVFLMNRDGSNVRQLTDSKWEDSMGVYLKQKAARGTTMTDPLYGDPAHPNISGMWNPEFAYFGPPIPEEGAAARPPGPGASGRPAGPPPRPPGPQLTPPYAKKYAEWSRKFETGEQEPDTVTRCLAFGVARFGTMPLEIIQTPGQVTMNLGVLHDIRRIYLDGIGHTVGADPSFNGDSIGRWEGDTLVVETNNIRAATIDRDGIPYSDRLTVVERIRRVGPARLEIETTLTDPEAFTSPFTMRRAYVPMPPGSRFEEYLCENNRDL